MHALLNIKVAEDQAEAYSTNYPVITEWIFSTKHPKCGMSYEKFEKSFETRKLILEEKGHLVGPDDELHETKRGPALLLSLICDIICTQFANESGLVSGKAWMNFKFNRKFYEKKILDNFGDLATPEEEFQEPKTRKKRKVSFIEDCASEASTLPSQTQADLITMTQPDTEGFEDSSDSENDEIESVEEPKRMQTITEVARVMGFDTLKDVMKKAEQYIFIQYMKKYGDTPEQDVFGKESYDQFLYPLNQEVTDFITSKMRMTVQLMLANHAAKGNKRLFQGSTLNPSFDTQKTSIRETPPRNNSSGPGRNIGFQKDTGYGYGAGSGGSDSYGNDDSLLSTLRGMNSNDSNNEPGRVYWSGVLEGLNANGRIVSKFPNADTEKVMKEILFACGRKFLEHHHVEKGPKGRVYRECDRANMTDVANEVLSSLHL